MPLRRADGLFDMLRVMRAASRPVTPLRSPTNWKSRYGRSIAISPRCSRGTTLDIDHQLGSQSSPSALKMT